MICDVSKHQGVIDWDKLAPNLDFVVIKASGLYSNGADPQYARNVAGAVNHNVPFHVFHFLYCTTVEEAKRDAALFYNVVKEQGHMPLFWVLDCEEAWGVRDADAPKVAAAFEEELRRRAGQDIKVAMYVAHQKYNDWALDYSHYSYVWIPRYKKVDDGQMNGKRPDHPCDLWQFTSHGKLPGISGDVDMDTLTGTKPMEFFTGRSAESIDERSDTNMLTSTQLVEYCKKVYAAAWVYWYGTYGKHCSQSLYTSKKKQYPAHYTAGREAGYKKDIASGKRCADCVGLIKSFFWTGGQFDTEPVYKANGCPDKSANGMIDICIETGPISTIPDIPGLVVWKSGHIGVYIGGGYTIEMRGFDFDCVKRKVTAGPWTKWGKLPPSIISYDGAPAPAPDPQDDVLKRGDKGAAVKEMQKALLAWDAKSLPRYGSDGDFGSETEKAVKAFQEAAGLPVTGVYDEATKEALTTPAPAPAPAPEPTPAPILHVVVTGGSVNVRSAPGTTGTRVIGVVHKGEVLEYQGVDKTVSGTVWHLVVYKNQNGWISEKYSRVE